MAKMKYTLEFMRDLLVECNNNKSEAARRLGMKRPNINTYLRRMYDKGMLDEDYNVPAEYVLSMIGKENDNGQRVDSTGNG